MDLSMPDPRAMRERNLNRFEDYPQRALDSQDVAKHRFEPEARVDVFQERDSARRSDPRPDPYMHHELYVRSNSEPPLSGRPAHSWAATSDPPHSGRSSHSWTVPETHIPNEKEDAEERPRVKPANMEAYMQRQDEKITQLQTEVKNLKKQLAIAQNNARPAGTRNEDYDFAKLKRRIKDLEAENTMLRDKAASEPIPSQSTQHTPKPKPREAKAKPKPKQTHQRPSVKPSQPPQKPPEPEHVQVSALPAPPAATVPTAHKDPNATVRTYISRVWYADPVTGEMVDTPADAVEEEVTWPPPQVSIPSRPFQPQHTPHSSIHIPHPTAAGPQGPTVHSAPSAPPSHPSTETF
eukprot:NODE_2346_length_1205_cov_10.617811_g2232_i0.p1 GENE.NODE_2346_length_1205_cov_10.617811_g2232_i0~~NODE_2346_length_1205_cov_10.617811_g2232_i0.p1  ORF type:complete len:351 (-),score=52.29 NODE_2346_length_1205_cov_10.617811_g2232_i0:95-1147(-)